MNRLRVKSKITQWNLREPQENKMTQTIDAAGIKMKDSEATAVQ